MTKEYPANVNNLPVLEDAKETASLHYRTMNRDFAEMDALGIKVTLVEQYSVGDYHYTNLADAVAQAHRMQARGNKS
ncbi:hypothetical protein [Altererythrobacter fulvus]|uniref:hypothetical protein n=1 Tax=Caenibius fulvus TaxID=2126012 RepID=UPI0030193769